MHEEAITDGRVDQGDAHLLDVGRAVDLVSRMMPQSSSVQASSLMIPRIMAGLPWSETDALAAYAPKARLWDRQEVWDPCRVQLALAYALLRRWDDLERFATEVIPQLR